MRALLLLVAAIAMMALAACGGDDDDDGDEQSPTPVATIGATPIGATPAPTVEPTVTASVVDCTLNLAGPAAEAELTWDAILPEDPPAPDGWAIEDAEGDAPLVAVVDDTGENVGTMELFQFPHDETFDPAFGYNALGTFVNGFYESIRTDREAAGGTWEQDDPVPTAFGDLCGIKYGFTVTDEANEVTERSVLAATFDADKLYLTSAFYDAAAAGEGGFNDLDSQQEFEPVFFEFVAALNVPAE